MRQRYTILVVAAVIASVIAPGMAMAAPAADAQVQQPDDAPEEVTVENVTVEGLTTVFTMEEMTLDSPRGDVMVEEAVVAVHNASMDLENATFENGSLTAGEGQLWIENATVAVTSAEIDMNDTTVRVNNKTFTIENRSLTMEGGSLEGAPADRNDTAVDPVPVDDDRATQVLRNATIDSMTIDGVSTSMSLDRASVEEITDDDRTWSGYVVDAQALVRNGSVTLENVRTENGTLMVEDGTVEVESGDALITEAHLEEDFRPRWTITDEVVSIDDRTVQFSDVELTPMEVLQMLSDAGDE